MQIECPSCGAPMWRGGRCPWDFGSGCVGRTLRVNALPERPVPERPAKVASVPTRKPEAARRHHSQPVGSRNRDPNRTTCQTGEHPRPIEGRCLECKRKAVRNFRARARMAA